MEPLLPESAREAASKAAETFVTSMLALGLTEDTLVDFLLAQAGAYATTRGLSMGEFVAGAAINYETMQAAIRADQAAQVKSDGE